MITYFIVSDDSGDLSVVFDQNSTLYHCDWTSTTGSLKDCFNDSNPQKCLEPTIQGLFLDANAAATTLLATVTSWDELVDKYPEILL